MIVPDPPITAEEWHAMMAGIPEQVPEFPVVMPENDLKPDPARLAFEIRTLRNELADLRQRFDEFREAVQVAFRYQRHRGPTI